MRSFPCRLRPRGLFSLWILAFATMVSGVQTSRAQDTPWILYNEGVQAYSQADYATAFKRWQDLSLQKVPHGLRRPVWFQLGNVQFRLGEPLEKESPEETAEFWRRSCEAYRSALTITPRDRNTRHNLALVERRLAVLIHRLGMEAFHASEQSPLDAAIDLLWSGIEHLDEATNLAPDDSQMESDRDLAWGRLRELLKDRAQAAEERGDEFVRQSDSWADLQAESQYRAALEDLGDTHRRLEKGALTPPEEAANREDALQQEISEAEQRVTQKLANVLTRMGQRQQQQGNQQAEVDPYQALGHYENALDSYRAAQEVSPGNVEAQAGEREVRLAMEKLHVKEGSTKLERGKEALAQKSSRAAAALSTALDHFESALGLNQTNTVARKGADEARRLLPEALTLAGQAELQAGDRAEPQSITDALSHYQEAEKDFRQSLEFKPGQEPAKKGLREAEAKLARARQRTAEEAENVAKVSQPQGKPPKTLQDLLGQVEEKERALDSERQRQRAQRDTRPRKYHADW